jgi:hypothetical protein
MPPKYVKQVREIMAAKAGVPSEFLQTKGTGKPAGPFARADA